MSWPGSDTGCLFDADYLKIASEREGHNKITEMMCPGDEIRADCSVVALPELNAIKWDASIPQLQFKPRRFRRPLDARALACAVRADGSPWRHREARLDPAWAGGDGRA